VSAARSIALGLPRPLLARERDDIAVIVGIKRLGRGSNVHPENMEWHRSPVAARPSEDCRLPSDLNPARLFDVIHGVRLQADHESATGDLVSYVKPAQSAFAPNSVLTLCEGPTS
jgi:hypothetical protein